MIVPRYSVECDQCHAMLRDQSLHPWAYPTEGIARDTAAAYGWRVRENEIACRLCVHRELLTVRSARIEWHDWPEAT